MKLGVKHLRAFLRPSDPFIKRLGRAANGQIEGVRALLVAGIQAVTEGMGIRLPEPYLWLLVHRMTWNGKVQAVSYHRIGSEFGPLKRAAFEQPLQTLLQAAQRGQTDTCTGPTEACIFSRRFDPTEAERTPAQQGECERSTGLWGDLTSVSQQSFIHAQSAPWGDLGGTVPQYPQISQWNSSNDLTNTMPCEHEAYNPESPSYNPTSPSYNPTSPSFGPSSFTL